MSSESGGQVLQFKKSKLCAMVKIQSEHKDQGKAENSKPGPNLSKQALPAKPLTRATITPVDQKPTPPPKPFQVSAAKSVSAAQSMTPSPQPKPTPAQQQPSKHHKVERQMASHVRRPLSPGTPLCKADQLLYRRLPKANISRSKPLPSHKPELDRNRSQLLLKPTQGSKLLSPTQDNRHLSLTNVNQLLRLLLGKLLSRIFAKPLLSQLQDSKHLSPLV